MSLIVEDGSQVPGAESYASVDDATAYFAGRGKGDTWGDVDDQESALRLATDYMEGAYRSRWVGYRVSTTQALSWPRVYVPIPDAPSGYGAYRAYVPINVVPAEVKNACIELALRASTAPLAPDLGRATHREKVGPIEVEYEQGAAVAQQYRAVDLTLAMYLSGDGPGVPLVRA